MPCAAAGKCPRASESKCEKELTRVTVLERSPTNPVDAFREGGGRHARGWRKQPRGTRRPLSIRRHATRGAHESRRRGGSSGSSGFIHGDPFATRPRREPVGAGTCVSPMVALPGARGAVAGAGMRTRTTRSLTGCRWIRVVGCVALAIVGFFRVHPWRSLRDTATARACRCRYMRVTDGCPARRARGRCRRGDADANHSIPHGMSLDPGRWVRRPCHCEAPSQPLATVSGLEDVPLQVARNLYLLGDARC